MRSYFIKSKADEFDQLVGKLVESQDADDLEHVMEVGKILIRGVYRYYGNLHCEDIFTVDMIIKCLQQILIEKETITPTRLLINMAHSEIKRLIEQKEVILPDMKNVRADVIEIQSRLIFEETLNEVLCLLPLRVQAGILYVLFFPNKDTVFRPLYSTLDYFLILKGLEQLRSRLSEIEKEKYDYFDFHLPISQTARLLLVSSLYKLSPGILVLLMQTKSLEVVLQFCKLFGGQNIKIPRIEELSSTIRQAAEMAQKVENGLRISDQESLAYLATELQDVKNVDYRTLSLNPLLSSFIHESLQTTLQNYEAYQKRLISSVDTTNPEDIIHVFSIMNKEVFSQAYLLLQLTLSIDEYPLIQKIVNILHSEEKK